MDALIDLVIRCRLRYQIPIRPDLRSLSCLRITVIPQWRPARRGDAGWLAICPDVVQDLPDICAMCDERDDAHLPTADRAQQREYFVNTGHQHRPQVVRCTLGRCKFGRRSHWITHGRGAICAAARGSRLGLRPGWGCGHSRHRSPELRIRCQHTKVAMPL
jgi:hypothetical protein